ncbi:hypothetical protein HDU99_001423, partial [Rhizoclosmatium hyalinum]
MSTTTNRATPESSSSSVESKVQLRLLDNDTASDIDVLGRTSSDSQHLLNLFANAGDSGEATQLWNEVAAVFGESNLGGRVGPVEAFKCSHGKDAGSLFIARHSLYFVPAEWRDPFDVSIQNVSLARTHSLKQSLGTKRLSIANNAKNLFVSKKESGVSLRVALSDSEDTSAANTAPASLPRNWRASRRSSAEHPPVEPPVSAQASSTASRRMSFFKSQNSSASAPIDDSSHTSHSPIEPFQIPVSSILSVTKTRSSPVHLTANAILIETRNTSDAVFSHTSKHVFYGFASAVKLPSLEKKISSLVEAWREKEGENVVKKKGVPRRPSVGTSALYSLLAGKDGDDYSHITSDLIAGDQLTSEKKVVAGPETIRLQVTKNLSGNGRVVDSDAENGLGGGTGEPQTIRSSEKSG